MVARPEVGIYINLKNIFLLEQPAQHLPLYLSLPITMEIGSWHLISEASPRLTLPSFHPISVLQNWTPTSHTVILELQVQSIQPSHPWVSHGTGLVSPFRKTSLGINSRRRLSLLLLRMALITVSRNSVCAATLLITMWIREVVVWAVWPFKHQIRAFSQGTIISIGNDGNEPSIFKHSLLTSQETVASILTSFPEAYKVTPQTWHGDITNNNLSSLHITFIVKFEVRFFSLCCDK